MELLTSVAAMRHAAESARAHRGRVVLVPTMGALHAGHLKLVEEAGAQGDAVVVSVFVNPTQFGEGEDFDAYPRKLEADRKLLEDQGIATHLFAPTVSEMYPDGAAAQRTSVVVEKLTTTLCGAYRPGHFDGVTTVVTMLFEITKPHVAVFGQKDAQQLAVIRRMVRDLHMPVTIVGVPIVRESDGLALSSRNQYLSDEERAQAPVLYEALQEAVAMVEEGELLVEPLVVRMREIIDSAPLAEPQYISVVDADSLDAVDQLNPGQQVLLAVAVYFGETRLIDNVRLTVPPE